MALRGEGVSTRCAEAPRSELAVRAVAGGTLGAQARWGELLGGSDGSTVATVMGSDGTVWGSELAVRAPAEAACTSALAALTGTDGQCGESGSSDG